MSSGGGRYYQAVVEDEDAEVGVKAAAMVLGHRRKQAMNRDEKVPAICDVIEFVRLRLKYGANKRNYYGLRRIFVGLLISSPSHKL